MLANYVDTIRIVKGSDRDDYIIRKTSIEGPVERARGDIVVPFYLCPPGTLSGGLAYTVAGFVDPRTTFVHFQRTPNAQDVFLHCAI